MAVSGEVMNEENNTMATIERDPVPDTFDSIDEMAAFWDAHSAADYEDNFTEVVEFEVSPTARSLHLYPIDKQLIYKLRPIAHKRGVSTETLINVLLTQALSKEMAVAA